MREFNEEEGVVSNLVEEELAPYSVLFETIDVVKGAGVAIQVGNVNMEVTDPNIDNNHNNVSSTAEAALEQAVNDASDRFLRQEEQSALLTLRELNVVIDPFVGVASMETELSALAETTATATAIAKAVEEHDNNISSSATEAVLAVMTENSNNTLVQKQEEKDDNDEPMPPLPSFLESTSSRLIIEIKFLIGVESNDNIM